MPGTEPNCQRRRSARGGVTAEVMRRIEARIQQPNACALRLRGGSTLGEAVNRAGAASSRTASGFRAGV